MDNRPWQSDGMTPASQILATAFRYRNHMGGCRDVAICESQLLKLFAGKKLKRTEMVALSEHFDLGCPHGKSWNPKLLQEYFDEYGDDYRIKIKRLLDIATEDDRVQANYHV